MKTYPAKLLLFGEHTVNLGSQALAVPLPLFSGRWRFPENEKSAGEASRQLRLPEFAIYLERLQRQQKTFVQLDFGSFFGDLSRGLYFDSNIPTGYGIGSSGALVAAIFDRYSLVREGSDLSIIKEAFAQMEGFFHGTSSGTDPLVCYLRQPVLLSKATGVKPVSLPDMHGMSLFLLDTGIERKATPLIEYFLEKSRKASFERACEVQLLPAVDGAIGACLSGNLEKLFREVHRIGAFQLAHLDGLIPEAFHPVWQAGLESDYFKLKVCGAGGGGFILGVTTNIDRLKAAYPDCRILNIQVSKELL